MAFHARVPILYDVGITHDCIGIVTAIGTVAAFRRMSGLWVQ